MLETAIADGAKKLGLQEKVAETCGVDTDVAALLVDISAAGGSVGALLAVGGGGSLVGLDLLIGVVDEIFLLLARHVVGGVENCVYRVKWTEPMKSTKSLVRVMRAIKKYWSRETDDESVEVERTVKTGGRARKRRLEKGD